MNIRFKSPRPPRRNPVIPYISLNFGMKVDKKSLNKPEVKVTSRWSFIFIFFKLVEEKYFQLLEKRTHSTFLNRNYGSGNRVQYVIMIQVFQGCIGVCYAQVLFIWKNYNRNEKISFLYLSQNDTLWNKSLQNSLIPFSLFCLHEEGKEIIIGTIITFVSKIDATFFWELSQCFMTWLIVKIDECIPDFWENRFYYVKISDRIQQIFKHEEGGESPLLDYY